MVIRTRREKAKIRKLIRDIAKLKEQMEEPEQYYSYAYKTFEEYREEIKNLLTKTEAALERAKKKNFQHHVFIFNILWSE